MSRIFVDTSVFLSFLTCDDDGQAARAEALFRSAASGSVELVTGPPVLFELVWSLRRAYGATRQRSREIVASLLALEGLVLLDAPIVVAAVELARESGQEFADAYIVVAAAAAEVAQIATFNEKHVRRLGATLYPWRAVSP